MMDFWNMGSYFGMEVHILGNILYVIRIVFTHTA